MGIMDRFSLDGQIAVVSGGGRGLGEQIARAFSEAGAIVVLGSRKVENCQHVCDELQAAGRVAAAYPLDLTDEEAIRQFVREVEGRFGRIDILVNNGGTSWGAPALKMPLEAWNKVMATNLTGAFLLTQAVAAGMKERGRGKVINIASAAGLRGTPPEVLDAVGYSASKGGLIALTRDLAVKWARYGICVNAIAPGFFPTQMTKDVLQFAGDAISNGIPMGRLGGAEDLQGAALYFASAASDYTTGQVLAVDGGMTV